MRGHDDRQLGRLAEQIRAIEKAGWVGHGRRRAAREDALCSTARGGGLADVVATGWPEVDRVLGGGGRDEVPAVSEPRGPVLDRGMSRGLQRRALHEWFGVADACAVKPAGIRDQPMGSSGHEGHSAAGLDAWAPPLCLLVHLAWQTLAAVHGMGPEVPATGCSAEAARRIAGTGEVVWIGRRCWPNPRVMVRRDADAGVNGKGQGKKLLQHSLFADPSGTASRLWAIDLALRSPAVTADGSGFDMAATRRLQLAAESGKGMVLLARPLHELSLLSVAATRWVVGWNGQERKEVKQESAGEGKVSVCDEARAYADIGRLQVEVPPFPKEIVKAGLQPMDIRQRAVAACKKAGVAVTDDEGDPKLSYKIGTIVDERFSDVVGFAVIIDMVQRARILRLDEELNFPTTSYILLDLQPADEIRLGIHKCADEYTQ